MTTDTQGHPMTEKIDDITVEWDAKSGEYVALASGFPSFTWLAQTRHSARKGMERLLKEVAADMQKGTK